MVSRQDQRGHRFFLGAAALVAALVATSLAAPAVAQTAPSISLQPTAGPPGTSVSVSGSNFPGKGDGVITFNGVQVTTYRNKQNGRFTANFTVPQVANGTYAVAAVSGGTTVASAPFTVQPAPATTTTTTPTTTTTSTSTTTTSPTTTTTTLPPPPPSYFSTKPPGSALPSDATCASWVRRGAFEPRPQNYTANHTIASGFYLPGFTPSDGGVDSRSRAYADRVTGNFTGTTDEIIQWASCKWGFDEDINRAVAVHESNWIQAAAGDVTYDATLCQAGYTVPCPQSFGLMQIKATTNKGTFAWSRDATAFNVDYVLMLRRICYEGWVDWLRQWYPTAGYAAGDEWGCVGFYYSGLWHDAGAEAYITAVKQHYTNKTWLQPGF